MHADSSKFTLYDCKLVYDFRADYADSRDGHVDIGHRRTLGRPAWAYGHRAPRPDHLQFLDSPMSTTWSPARVIARNQIWCNKLDFVFLVDHTDFRIGRFGIGHRRTLGRPAWAQGRRAPWRDPLPGSGLLQ